LSWVTARITKEKLRETLTDNEKALYAEVAAQKRAQNKDNKTASISRKKAIKSAQDELTKIHEQVSVLQARIPFCSR
jgi:hypothetical protein